MEFKKLANNTINFGINRIIEIAGIALFIIGLLLLVSLATFSPDDPNFIFPDNTEIKNLLGFNGSYAADLFFQTFGLIALLIPFTLIFSGINVILNKKFFFSLFCTIVCANKLIWKINWKSGVRSNFSKNRVMKTVQKLKTLIPFCFHHLSIRKINSTQLLNKWRIPTRGWRKC